MRAAGIPEYDGPRISALRRFWTSLRSYALQDTHFDALGHKGGGCRIAQGGDPRSVREIGILDVFELIRAAGELKTMIIDISCTSHVFDVFELIRAAGALQPMIPLDVFGMRSRHFGRL